ncbi:MAG: response regulator [Acidobacteria bacterium]|nr:MAG: response regulator [Acidobacteriota bacterium]
MDESKQFGVVEGGKTDECKPISVLLLDDREENLLIRSTILRQKGYHVVTSASIQEAESKLMDIDIAVLDYHLGAGTFGTDVANTLRAKRPEVPIIILSATLERKFGGIADMHLLKGYSSVEDLLQALRSFEAKRRGRPVVVDSRDFYYSRIIMAMGDDMVIEILDREGNWQYVNEYFAALSHQRRAWYQGRNIFEYFPEMRDEWGEIIRTVADTRETYIDRRNHRAMQHLPAESEHWQWNVLVFPIKLHDGRDGVVLSARLIERK